MPPSSRALDRTAVDRGRPLWTKRIGTPGDIAGATAFLLGPEATFITGTDLTVDSGVVAATRTLA